MEKVILTFVGMPGSGKSEAVKYLQEKGIPFVRFGQITDEGVTLQGLPLTPENERVFRENIRQELGMAAYAIRSKPKIDELLKENRIIAIDGLYSWEEYTFLEKEYKDLVVIQVFADRKKRYERLGKRPVRPVPLDECYTRDVTEVENLNKAGPIAMADFLVKNNTDELSDLHRQIDEILQHLQILQ